MHLNTGFILKHLEGDITLGYKFYNKISQCLILEIDNKNLLSNLYVKVGVPSFIVSVNDKFHVYYVFKEKYYIQDLSASFLSKYPDLPVRLFDKNDIIPLPLGNKSHRVSPGYPIEKSMGYTKLQQIDFINRNFKVYDKLERICPHIKTYLQHDSKYKKHIVSSNSYTDLNINKVRPTHTSIAFCKDNLSNSLIQLFNKHCNTKEDYMTECSVEDFKIVYWEQVPKEFAEDTQYTDEDFEKVPYNEGLPIVMRDKEERLIYYSQFYDYMRNLKDKSEYKTIHKHFMKTDFTSYQIFQIKKYLRCLPEYKKLEIYNMKKLTAQKNFISFSLKILNYFNTQSLTFKNNDIYYLPSTLMLKLDKNYYKYKEILFKYFTKTVKEYYHGTVGYKCRGYNLNIFRSLIKYITKYNIINISYYIYKNTVYKYNYNYYLIFPDLKKFLKKIKDIMKDLGYKINYNIPIKNSWSRQWCLE